MVVRDEIGRLPFTLAHHRALGVDRFFVVDNGSRDGTTDYLLAQPDVHVFSTRVSYLESRLGIDWIEALLARYGEDRWSLIIDGDEHFVYPDCEFFRLPAFCKALEAHGLDCLATVCVDLYADRPIADTVIDGRPLIETCPFFDEDGYYSFHVLGSSLPRLYGGPRGRLFWPELNLSQEAALGRAYIERAFDEDEYLSLFPDVRAAVADGTVRSGLDHFARFGRGEARRVSVRPVTDWPDETYLASNPDVLEAVRRGEFASGLQHYVAHGHFESRTIAGAKPPCLSLFPLVRWRAGMRFEVGRHRLNGTTWRRDDAVGGALLHFRLMADLSPRSDAVADRPDATGQAWNLENQRYRDVLRANPSLSAIGWSSVRYRDARQLLELKILADVPEL